MLTHSSLNKRKVILDTDIGDDIDDSFALLLLLKSNAFDVLGVTTVFRNTEKRGLMAKQLIKSLGYDVEVYPGINNPLKAKIDDLIQENIRKKEVLDENGLYLIPQFDESMRNETISDINAVDFIISQVHKYPHEVTLIPIGPLTNIASAIKKDPTIIPLIKEIRIMGGGYGLDWGEWNIFCDPEAADIVYSSNVNLHAVGFNVTIQTGLTPQDVEDLKNSNSPTIKLVYKAMMKWFSHYEFTTPVMHDPLTVASLLDETILTFKEENMKVDLINVRGKTYVDNELGSKVYVATEVDKTKFFNLFKKVLDI
jgi:purine nucleosidase/pyrimidine-specific ribonucleoside hydrolase